jgi:hypothetical protein
MSTWLLRLAGATLLLLGIAIAMHGLPSVQQAWQSPDWPTTQAILTRSEVQDNAHGGSTRQNRDNRDSFSRYRHVVAYHYAVAGVEYDGDRKDFDDGYSAAPELETDDSPSALMMKSSGLPVPKRKWSVGSTVTVHYKPDEPSVSVLDPGLKGRACFIFVGGVVLAFFGALTLFLGRSPTV